MRVLKIGGSLLTVKSNYCTVNTLQVARFGHELAALTPQLRKHLILVIGGGSFGNGIPLRYGLDHPETVDPLDVSRMTLGMFELMGHLVGTWRAAGVAAFPVQACSVISRCGDGYRLNIEPFLSLLDRGVIPLVTGDLLPLEDWPIISSDWLPVLIAAETKVDDVTYLTNVAGLCTDPLDETTLVEVVDEAYLQNALGMSSGARFDVTGGMRTKVGAAGALLRMGVPASICDGRVAGALSAPFKQAGAVRATRFITPPVTKGGK